MPKKFLKRLFEVPAITVEKTLDTSKQLSQAIVAKQPFKQTAQYWQTLGPGLTTGAADDDPSGIATYSQVGARYGFQLLWLAPFTFPLMAVVQEMCARIGMVTGRGLASNIRRHYPKSVLYLTTALLFFANAFNIGADLGAMGKATQLLLPRLSFSFLLVTFTILSLTLQIFTSYEKYARYLKWLSLILLSYVFSALVLRLNWAEVFRHTIIPSLDFSGNGFLILTAVLGTTISPYLFFWQTAQEVEQEILGGRITIKARAAETTKEEVRKMRTDVWSGMFFSNLVMFFIIAVSAGTLFAAGQTNINTAAQAAAALRPLAGDRAYFLFTLGIVGTGLLAIPVLAGSASYALSESFGWKQGLYRKLPEAYAFYGVIIVAMLVGLLANFVGLDPIKALIYSAASNGIIAPIILALVVDLSSRKQVMGAWVNSSLVAFWGWVVTGIMFFASVITVLFIIFQ